MRVIVLFYLYLRSMKKIGVIGSGTMGIGIAQVAATQNCEVYLFDVNIDQTNKAVLGLKKTLDRLAEKGKITQTSVNEILSLVKACSSLQELNECELIIEAIVENKDVKTRVFSELENYVSTDCILASNTSSISITSLSSELKNPERFIGIHFFNPAPLMPLVEIIPGLLTKDNLAEQMLQLMQNWGKSPVLAKDIPGFIVNRIARPFYGEALRIVEENIGSPEQVDFAMKSIGGFKMGPFELMDLIGIDVNFAVTKTVYQDYFFDSKYKPSLLQQRMVEAKLLGRKTCKGFYNYSQESKPDFIDNNSSLHKEIFDRIISMLINEAVEAKRLKIASDVDLEMAMQKGVNYPKGLLEWGQEIGFQKVSKILSDLYTTYQEDRYRQSPLLNKLAQH